MLYFKKTNKGIWNSGFEIKPDFQGDFTITTDSFFIRITGGSVKIFSNKSKEIIKMFNGFNYLYTCDVKPDESELFALENGKHFYIFSLDTFEQKYKITLPRKCNSIDVLGEYSSDGKFLYVPVSKSPDTGFCEYYMCTYETENYTLVDTKNLSYKEAPFWSNSI